MKKISLKNLDLDLNQAEILGTEELKKVIGGARCIGGSRWPPEGGTSGGKCYCSAVAQNVSKPDMVIYFSAECYSCSTCTATAPSGYTIIDRSPCTTGEAPCID